VERENLIRVSLELEGVKVIIFSRKDLPVFAGLRQTVAEAEPACGDAAKKSEAVPTLTYINEIM
jgi:hypothetical protein